MVLVDGQLSVFPVIRWSKQRSTSVFGVPAGMQMSSPGQESAPRSFSASPLQSASGAFLTPARFARPTRNGLADEATVRAVGSGSKRVER
jgi:hypothetical protein